MPQDRSQIGEWRNELNRKIAQDCFLLFIILNCLFLLSKEVFAASPDLDIKNVLSAQYRTVRDHYPDAKLFQVFVLGLVPDRTMGQPNVDLEVHGYFDVHDLQGFVEAVTRNSKTTVEVVKPFKGNDCFHGHPASRSEACLPTVKAPTADENLNLDWVLDLTKLAAAFRKNGLDPTMPFDVTIASARRIVSTWQWSDLQTASAVRERLNKDNANEPIVSVTEHSRGRGGGVTWLFGSADYQYIGTVTFAASRRLPPAR